MEFFGKEISGPIVLPSGVVATEVSVLERIANIIPEIGILTTKSIGLEPRQGNREPIIAQHSAFSFINAVGLANPGAEEFAKRLSRIVIPKYKFLLVSIFGKDEFEFQKTAKILFDYADGFELNISCPHSNEFGQTIGKDSQLAGRIVKAVACLGKPVLVKISPNMDIEEVVRQAVRAGASGITAINTRGPEFHFHNHHSVLSNVMGGVSGKEILELGLQCVKKVRAVTNLPMIVGGGISGAKDVLRYRKAGARGPIFPSIGSALAGMSTAETKNYFSQLLIDMKEGTNKAEQYLKQDLNMEYQEFRIKERKQRAGDLFFLKLNKQIEAEPGQFVFVWLPGETEKPFSVFDNKPLTLLIKKRGSFTRQLSALRRGNILYIRGPHGNPIKADGKTLLVGGGTGLAGLYLFSKTYQGAIAFLGAKDKKHLYERFQSTCQKVYLATEDGSLGSKGMVTDFLGKIIKKVRPEYCLNCGPAIMMEKAIQIEERYVESEKILSSADFLTQCGIGLCGRCATSEGYRSCVDGPFLRANQI